MNNQYTIQEKVRLIADLTAEYLKIPMVNIRS